MNLWFLKTSLTPKKLWILSEFILKDVWPWMVHYEYVMQFLLVITASSPAIWRHFRSKKLSEVAQPLVQLVYFHILWKHCATYPNWQFHNLHRFFCCFQMHNEACLVDIWEQSYIDALNEKRKNDMASILMKQSILNSCPLSIFIQYRLLQNNYGLGNNEVILSVPGHQHVKVQYVCQFLT